MGAVAVLRLTAFLAAALALPAHAHHPAPHAWGWEALVLLLVVASAVFYASGLLRLWRRAGRGRGIAPREVALFATGWLAVSLALLSPLDRLAETYFAAHMVQHELLMAVAAPLLVLGRPLEAWTWALRASWRAPVAAALTRPRLVAAWDFLTEPMVAWTAHAIAIWAWHVPQLFGAALADPGVHALQHASFLGTALLFWWSVFGGALRRPDGASVVNLFTTMLHSGGLGALLTFAPTVWYAHYADLMDRTGLSALEDQQLGGLVMWGPGGLTYLIAGLAIVGTWLRRGRRAYP